MAMLFEDTYDKSRYYSLERLNQMSDKEVRELYRKTYKNYSRRVNRIAKTEGGEYNPNVRRLQSGEIPKLSEIDREGLDLRKEMRQLSKYESMKSSTVKGDREFRKTQLDYFRNERGYNFLNEKNIYKFLSYMESLRTTYGSTLFDSDGAVEVFAQVEKKRLKMSDVLNHFNEYIDNIEALEARPDRRPDAPEATIRNIRRWKYTDEEGTPYVWKRNKYK